MSIIDKQRVAAVATLQALGYTFSLGDGWSQPDNAKNPGTSVADAEADAMHAMLVLRSDALEGSTEGSPEETEFASIAKVVEAYEAKRWPDGTVPRGKG